LKALKDGRQKLQKANYSLTVPDRPEITSHNLTKQERDTLAVVKARSLSQLKGITEKTSQNIKRVFSAGLQSGKNPNKIASELNKEVDTISITRSRTLARTELANAHVQAVSDMYEQAGAKGVEVEIAVLFGVAPCPICKKYANRRLTVAEFRSIFPAHPNCECSSKPIPKDLDF